jgi:hypothetical protein
VRLGGQVHGLVAYAGLVLTAFIYVPFGAILVPHLAGLAHKFIKQQDSIPLEGSPDLYLNTRALDFSTYSINTARLYEQLFAYQVTNQLVDTFSEVGLPYLIKIASFRWNKLWVDRQEKRRLANNSPDVTSRSANSTDAPDEHELLERLREEAKLPEYRLFVEYAEMAIQVRFDMPSIPIFLLFAIDFPSTCMHFFFFFFWLVWLCRIMDGSLADFATVFVCEQLLRAEDGCD